MFTSKAKATRVLFLQSCNAIIALHAPETWKQCSRLKKLCNRLRNLGREKDIRMRNRTFFFFCSKFESFILNSIHIILLLKNYRNNRTKERNKKDEKKLQKVCNKIDQIYFVAAHLQSFLQKNYCIAKKLQEKSSGYIAQFVRRVQCNSNCIARLQENLSCSLSIKWLHNFFRLASLLSSFRRVQCNNCIAGLQKKLSCSLSFTIDYNLNEHRSAE